MKKALKVLGIALGTIVLLVALAAAYNQFAPFSTYEVNAPDLKVKPDSTRLARGAQIVAAACTTCHQGEKGKLDGRLMEDDPSFGVIYLSLIHI